MDVAGSAVGIVSLGIQVCQDLLTYYKSWKGYEQDIASTRASLEGLEKTFSLLKDALTVPSYQPDIVLRVQESINSCQDGVDSLNKKLDKVRKTSATSNPNGFGERARLQARRVLYPFKESTLVKLREIVQDLRENLNLAVEVLQLDTGATTLRELNVLGGQLRSVSLDVSNVRSDVALVKVAQTDMNHQKILSWLSTTDPSSMHETASKRHEPKTGDWIVQRPEFHRWKTSPNSLLWLYAGCGKTILCFTIIEHIVRHCAGQPRSTLAYFYFSFSDTRNQNIVDFLSSLIVQLHRNQPVTRSLQDLYDKSQPGRPTVQGLIDTLNSIITQLGDTYIVIDALDECPQDAENREREDVLQWLEDVFRSSHANLHILVTSRKEPDIERSLLIELQSPSIYIKAAQNRDDIRKYIEGELARHKGLKALDNAVKEVIRTTLCGKSNGMFRWVFCQLDEIKQLKLMRRRDIEKVLRSLPKTLDEMYERILTRIDEQYRQEAFTALQWLAFSIRPLSIEALAEACIVDPEGDPAVDEHKRFKPEGIFEILSSLIIISPRRVYKSTLKSKTRVKKVQLAHFSVKEYLTSNRIRCGSALSYGVQEALAHAFLARSCLSYIWYYSQHSDKKHGLSDLGTFPLLECVCREWFRHTKMCSDKDQEVLADLIVGLFTSQTPFSDWRRIIEDLKISYYPGRSFLYYACLIGLDKVVRLLLNKGASIYAQGGFYNDILEAAIGGGNEKVIELLLDNGAPINAQLEHYGSLLHAASERGHEEIVKLLPDRGADLNAQYGHHGNALHVAISRDRKEIAKLLLDRGADVEARDEYYGTIPNAAAYHGHVVLLQTIMGKIADRDIVDDQGRSALHFAARGGHPEAVDYLLSLGLDPNAKDKRGETVLHYAASGASIEVVRKLLHVCPLSLTQNTSWTPLHWACRTGDAEVVRLLSNQASLRNAVATTEPPGLWTPLSIALFHQNRNLVSEEGRVLHDDLALQDTSSESPRSDTNTGSSRETKGRLLHMQAGVIHHAICDGCQHYIYGPPFKCQVCPDFDFCFMCKVTSDQTHPGHTWNCFMEAAERRKGGKRGTVDEAE